MVFRRSGHEGGASCPSRSARSGYRGDAKSWPVSGRNTSGSWTDGEQPGRVPNGQHQPVHRQAGVQRHQHNPWTGDPTCVDRRV